MNFDLNWFTTIPGLLITGGVLLLVIALIIFIVTSVKGKKAKNVGEDAASSQVQSQATVVNATVDAVQAQTVAVDSSIQQAGVVMQPQVAAVDANAINPVMQPTPLNTVTPTDAGTVNLDAVPAPTIPMEQVASVQQPVMPEVQAVPVAPVENVMPTPAEMMAVQQAMPVDAVQPVQSVAPEVQVAPVISNETLNIQTPSVDVSTQQVPGVEVVSSVPTVEVVGAPSMEFNPVVPQVAPVEVAPVMTDYQNVNVVPAVEVNSVETLGDVQSVVPSIAPVEVVPAVESVAPTINVAPEVPVLDINPVGYNIPAQENVSIYGGVSPVVPNVASDINQPHQIYGGANPLENTQSVPIVNIANENAYVAQENVAPVEPAVNVVPQYTATPAIPTVNQSVQMTAAPVVTDQVTTVQQPQVVPVQQTMPQYGQPIIQPVNQQVVQPVGQQVGIQ